MLLFVTVQSGCYCLSQDSRGVAVCHRTVGAQLFVIGRLDVAVCHRTVEVKLSVTRQSGCRCLS